MKKVIIIVIVLFFSLKIFGQDGDHSSNKNVVIDNNIDPNIHIEKLYQLNSDYRDINLSITPDGKYLYFMSTRGGQPWSIQYGYYKGHIRYDGDIWYSENIGGKWSSPRVVPEPVNSLDGEDEPCIMPDGLRVVYQSWRSGWESNRGPYYMAELNGTEWGSPVGLGGGINRFFKKEMDKYGQYGTDGMSISPDGKLFVVACGYDYNGKLDLYYSRKISSEWTYLKKMNISTAGDERSVFIAADNRTIYFASDGLGGYGGLDIFRGTINEKGQVTDVENIGKPFNSQLDDFGFIITADGRQAYFVREDDIYMATFDTIVKNIAPTKSLLIGGNLYGCDNTPKVTHLILTSQSGDIIAESKTSEAGRFLFSTEYKEGIYQIKDTDGKIIQVVEVKNTTPTELNFKIVQCNPKIGRAVVKH